VPVEFLTDEQAGAYGRFSATALRSRLRRRRKQPIPCGAETNPEPCYALSLCMTQVLELLDGHWRG
jgi:hypothetical protein